MDPFIGEIRMFSGTFAPQDWLLCQGQTLQISQYQALYAVLGVIYGGDGRTTFKLPDLRGRVPIGAGTGDNLTPKYPGYFGGYESVNLDVPNIPPHIHDITNETQVVNNLSVAGSGTIKCKGDVGDSKSPSNAFPAATKTTGGDNIYATDQTKATATMNSDTLALNLGIQGDVDVTVTSNCHSAGGGIAHTNMQPWLCLNFIIAYNGVFPPRP